MFIIACKLKNVFTKTKLRNTYLSTWFSKIHYLCFSLVEHESLLHQVIICVLVWLNTSLHL
jgi:hypothetical protein